jgi:ketosteroid isomerase-like protein
MTSNLEIVRAIWADFPRGGVDAVVHRFAPDFEWVIDAEQRVVRGHEGLREYFRELEEMGAEVAVLPYDFEEQGDFVLVPGTIRIQTERSMAEFQVHLVYELRDGLVIRARSYSDPGAARAAMTAAEREGSERA